MTEKKRLLGMAMDFGRGDVPAEERLAYIAQAGFDATFCGWRPDGDLCAVAALIKKQGLILQSVHAPFNKVNLLWQEGRDGDDILDMLCRCLDDCAAAGAPIMVCHVWIGFGEQHPNDIGIARFSALLDHAARVGVKVAFENTEGEKYLEYLWKKLSSHPAAGFCIDTGHEMCYNYSHDLITKYGSGGKLIATHINDNLGITGDAITWLDDSHLLPFDGVADWQGVAHRLNSVGYDGILMSELTTKNKPDRHTHDIYDHLSCRDYVFLAYERLAKMADLMN